MKKKFVPTIDDYRIHGRDRVEKWIKESKTRKKKPKSIKPYHKAKKGTVKKYAGILSKQFPSLKKSKLGEWDAGRWWDTGCGFRKKSGVDLHLTRKDAKYLQLRLSGFTPPPSENKRGLRILNKLKREGVR